MPSSEAHSAAIASPRSCASSRCAAHQRAEHTTAPVCRRDADDRRPAALAPTRREPTSRNGIAPVAPIIASPSHALSIRSTRRNAREAPAPALGAVRAEVLPDLHQRAPELGLVPDTGGRRCSSRHLLERRVLEHQPPLGAVLEAHRHDAVRLDARDDPRCRACRGAPRRPSRATAARCSFGGDEPARGAARRSSTTTSAAAAPARRPPAGSSSRKRDGRFASLRPYSERRIACSHRQPLLRARHADVAEPPLLLDVVLLDRARVREDPLLHRRA